MTLDPEQFNRIIAEALNELPEYFQAKLHNVALFSADFPSREQMETTGTKNKWGLLGLFEGYAQARRLNFGPVLPDRITLFRRPLLQSCSSEKDCRDRIRAVLRHEIAHHFGLHEKGARRAESRTKRK